MLSLSCFGTAKPCKKPCGAYNLFCDIGSKQYTAVVPNVFESGRASVIMSYIGSVNASTIFD